MMLKRALAAGTVMAARSTMSFVVGPSPAAAATVRRAMSFALPRLGELLPSFGTSPLVWFVVPLCLKFWPARSRGATGCFMIG